LARDQQLLEDHQQVEVDVFQFHDEPLFKPLMLSIHAILLADETIAGMIGAITKTWRQSPMELHIEPLGRVLPVAPGANLLEVLRAHQIPVSYSCMAGRCGTCRCKVIAGEVLDSGQALRMPPLGGDGGAQYVMACQTVLSESCTIEIPEPTR
ncbi:hypothetical protein FE89_33770, partial [Azospirillum brasilense]